MAFLCTLISLTNREDSVFFVPLLYYVYHSVFYFSLSAFSPVSPDAWQFFRVSGSLKALSIMTFGT